jgi:hypothetical protein
MHARPAPWGWLWDGLFAWLVLLTAPSHTLDLTEITTLYNPNCVQWAIVGPCYCNLYTPCLLVTYWEPGWLVETVKQPGTTTLAPMQGLMTAAWGALGLPQLGGGGAGGTAGSGRTNLHYNEAHVVPFPNVFGGPCTGCSGQADLRVNYLSEIDPLWRTATGGTALLEHLGFGPLGTWAPLYPRVGFGIHGSEPVGSAIAAGWAMDIAAHPQGDPTQPDARVVLEPTQGFSHCCQLAQPKQTRCFPVGTTPAVWEHGTGSRDGTYLWIWWRQRLCCVEPDQATCGITLTGGYGANTCVE